MAGGCQSESFSETLRVQYGEDGVGRRKSGQIASRATSVDAARLFLLLSFPYSADHERDWPPCKVVFFGLATNTLK